MNIRYNGIYDVFTVGSNGFAKGTVAAEAYFQLFSGSNKFSASIPEVTSRGPCTLSRKTKWQRSFGVETGLCHCLEISDKLGTWSGASWGKNAPPRSACEVPEVWWKEKDKMGNSQGESTMGEENSRKRNFHRYSFINPKEHWCETRETVIYIFSTSLFSKIKLWFLGELWLKVITQDVREVD